MDSKRFVRKAKQTVVDYYNKLETSDKAKITEEDVYVVWLAKALQNNKALLSTTIADGMYFELTYNGDKNEMYVDAYKKCENIVIKF